MSAVSTHVLDSAAGQPASGVAVSLSRLRYAEQPIATAVTDTDGRVAGLGPDRLPPGDYQLTFDVGGYYSGRGVAAFYPEVVVAFRIAEGGEHYHVPLLLAPFAYSTYRGS